MRAHLLVRRFALRLAALALLLASACEEKKGEGAHGEGAYEEPSYGDPVGIQMEPSKDVPAFEIVVAVSKDVAIDPLVPPLGGLIHGAMRACPGFVKAAAASAPVQISLTVEQGKTQRVSVSGVSGEPSDCMMNNLNARELAGAGPAKVHVLAMLRFPSAQGKDAEGPKP